MLFVFYIKLTFIFYIKYCFYCNYSLCPFAQMSLLLMTFCIVFMCQFPVLIDHVLETALSMQQDSSVVMTAPALRSWRQTPLGAVLQTERTTGAHLHSTNPLVFPDSPTGSMTSSASTTAACGLTTATTTSNTGPPATAGVTSRPAQVSQQQCYALCYSQDHCSSHFLCVIPAVVFGDPHFITFDGVSYSFNGKGEYNLVTSAKKQLTIQGRTEPVNGEKGTVSCLSQQTPPLKNVNM